jgi:predicted ABC-class ATPase
LITIDRPGQEVLDRNTVYVAKEYVEARFAMRLPAFGRRIAGREAEAMFLEEVPRIVISSLLFENLDRSTVYNHIPGDGQEFVLAVALNRLRTFDVLHTLEVRSS